MLDRDNLTGVIYGIDPTDTRSVRDMLPGSYTRRLKSRPLTATGMGIAGVLLIHTLLLLPFVLNLSLPSLRRPIATGAGSTSYVTAAGPDMIVIFIDEPTPAETSPKPPLLASRGISPPNLQLVVLSPDPLPAAANSKADDSDDALADTRAAEAVEHAKLYGRYVGQLQARIERAWMRPRTEIGAPQFSCRIRIRQDRRGNLVSADLDHCNGTERWQRSLLSAIRTASPLPAPPDPSVYADVLWLSFESGPFEEGDSAQGFEPVSRFANVTDRTAAESFQRSGSGSHGDFKTDDKETSKVIHLTIIGTPSDRPPPAPVAPEPQAPTAIDADSSDPSPR